MTEQSTPLFQVEKNHSFRLKKELAEKLNKYAKMWNMENKTDVLHKYIEELEGKKPKLQAELIETILCGAFNKPIALESCWAYQEKPLWKQKYCLECRGKRP